MKRHLGPPEQDEAGRRTAVGGSWTRTNLPAALGSATYDDANQVATWEATGFTYDDNGNLTGDGVRSYTWNARNQLTALSGPVSASFGYDGFARRRTKTVGGTTTGFLYDGLNPVQELAGGLPAASLVTGLGIDEYFTRTDGAGARHVLTDALGSTVALVDGSGAVQTEYNYEPYGGLTTSGAASGNAFTFTGREADGTGLFFYRPRYYHPRLQRFVSEDPLSFEGGDTNLHAYVGNRPTLLVDPTGEFWVLPMAGCLGGAFGAGLGGMMTGRKPEWVQGCAIGLTLGLGAAGAGAGAGGAGAGGAGAGPGAGGAGLGAGAATTSGIHFTKHGIDQVVNPVATWQATGFTYDDNGNLTGDGVRTYTWNARNQLTALSGPVSGNFGYDGFGRRRTKTVGGTRTGFLYDGESFSWIGTRSHPQVSKPARAWKEERAVGTRSTSRRSPSRAGPLDGSGHVSKPPPHSAAGCGH